MKYNKRRPKEEREDFQFAAEFGALMHELLLLCASHRIHCPRIMLIFILSNPIHSIPFEKKKEYR